MSLYDKNMSQSTRASMEFAEQSREEEWQHPSFSLQIFHGEVNWKLVHPFPDQSAVDRKKGDDFLKTLTDYLKKNLDPDEVDRTGVISDAAIKGLADLKVFAMKVPEEYGGLGLSQVNYNRAMHLISTYCGSTSVLISAHQSIGVPQPLKLFGTEEQKAKYFPKFVKGAISAFALTEPEAGSDPRNMTTTATPSEDGQYFVINGEKLWCTNGLIADVIVVMAVTPPKMVKGKEQKQITAFIVDMDSPGIEKVHRCQFMGLHGIQNGLIRFHNVRVPKSNIIAGEGEGLKLALTTLNTGRLTMPAASAGVAKWCLSVARQWSNEREQWGSHIGEHESVALTLSDMAAQTLAIDAVCWLSSHMADQGNVDIRLEAAMAKYFCTERVYELIDTTLQIRAGQGYEQASSLKARGMHDWPVERVYRDMRINMIIEGTSDIMRLFIAREALDPVLKTVKGLLMSSRFGKKVKASLDMGGHILNGYKFSSTVPETLDDELKVYARYVNRTSRLLNRKLMRAMLRHQKKLATKQSILNRIVDVGVELFAMSACISYAHHLKYVAVADANAIQLAKLYCRSAQKRIAGYWASEDGAYDRQRLKMAKSILKSELHWLENDIIAPE